MSNVQASLEKAMGLMGEGRHKRAAEILRPLSRLQGLVIAKHLLGLCEYELGNAERGLRLLIESVQAERNPTYSENLVALYIKMQDFEQAYHYTMDALAHFPRQETLLYYRALCLLRMSHFEDAIAAYTQLLNFNPGHIEAVNELCVALAAAGRSEEAIARFSALTRAYPQVAEFHYNFGKLLDQLAKTSEAIESYRRALSLDPNYFDALMGLAGILEDAGRHDESLASFNRAIELRPDSADAHNNLGNLFFLKRRFQDALKSYDMALFIDKDLPYVQGQRLHMKLMCGNWENIGAELSALRNAVKQGKPCALPFAFLSLGDSFEDYARVVDAMVVEKNVKFKNLRIEPAPSSDGRIRLAYISADFREHPIAKSLASILELHDRSRFEVHGISIGPTDTSNDAERAIKGCDSFHDMYGKSEREIGQLVKDLGIDILLVTAVHTQYSNIELFAERYAPIQVNFLSAWSSGLEFFDYMTADPRCVDADERRYFSEKLVSIKGFISDEAQVVPDVKPGREDCGLPKDAFVFACFNDGYKITPDVFDAWVNILRRVEGSVLWLKDSPNSRDALRAEALKRNIDPTRLIFAPRVASISDHLARLHLADLTLDTLPYGGHTTMRDSLFAGVPFITQKGGTFVGRIGSSLLDDVDLTELIVTSAEQYENLAVDLAHNKARLDEIRTRLRQTLSSRGLFNRQKYTAELDTALVAMYDRHKAGLPPDHIEEASITALRSA